MKAQKLRGMIVAVSEPRSIESCKGEAKIQTVAQLRQRQIPD